VIACRTQFTRLGGGTAFSEGTRHQQGNRQWCEAHQADGSNADRGAQQYTRAQLDRGSNVADHPEMDAAPSRIVSVLLGVIMIGAIVLWGSFIFEPSWLDRVLALISSCC
jgi:hypothetical protein